MHGRLLQHRGGRGLQGWWGRLRHRDVRTGRHNNLQTGSQVLERDMGNRPGEERVYKEEIAYRVVGDQVSALHSRGEESFVFLTSLRYAW